MPIYDFNQSVTQVNNGLASQSPAEYPIGMSQSSDLNTPVINSIAGQRPGFTDILTGKLLWENPSDEHDFTEPALRPLEEALKMYFSGIRVPYKDGYRLLRVKIASPQRSLAIWRDDLINGRAVIPVGSISRAGLEYDKTRYAPPYHPMMYRYHNRSGSSVSLVYKPTPVIVSYNLSVMCETKTDDGHIMTTIMRRFQSGVAEFVVRSDHLQWVARANFGGGDNQTEQKIDDGAKSFIVTVYKMAIEAYLPLPERTVPTALVINRELLAPDGTILDRQRARG